LGGGPRVRAAAPLSELLEARERLTRVLRAALDKQLLAYVAAARARLIEQDPALECILPPAWEEPHKAKGPRRWITPGGPRSMTILSSGGRLKVSIVAGAPPAGEKARRRKAAKAARSARRKAR
jgi:hypothetical protein